MDKIKELEQAVNDYIVKSKYYEYEFFYNISFFNDINYQLYILVEDYLDETDISEDNLIKCSLYDLIELIKEFYKECNIDLDLDKLLKDGTIDFKFDDKVIISGRNYYSGVNKFKAIDVSYSGHIINSEVLVHELNALDKDSYKNLYNDNVYDEIINDFNDNLTNIDLYEDMYYSFGYFIALYLYSEYPGKENYEFIIKLYDDISNNSIDEVLDKIDFPGIGQALVDIQNMLESKKVENCDTTSSCRKVKK